jgi:hypothetical protein
VQEIRECKIHMAHHENAYAGAVQLRAALRSDLHEQRDLHKQQEQKTFAIDKCVPRR